MRAFAESVERCIVIEEGDPYLVEGARTACIAVEGKPESFRFGELNSARVRRILDGDSYAGAEARSRQAACLLPRLSASQRLSRR